MKLEELGVAAGFLCARATVALPGYMYLQGPGGWPIHRLYYYEKKIYIALFCSVTHLKHVDKAIYKRNQDNYSVKIIKK
jgi:hypothetical protein